MINPNPSPNQVGVIKPNPNPHQVGVIKPNPNPNQVGVINGVNRLGSVLSFLLEPLLVHSRGGLAAALALPALLGAHIPLYIAYISPISPLYLPISPLYLPTLLGAYIPLYLPYIPSISPISPLHLPVFPLYLPALLGAPCCQTRTLH